MGGSTQSSDHYETDNGYVKNILS